MLRIGSVIVLSIVLAIASTAVYAGPKASTLYVATNGNDAWSGHISEPNASGTDGPFATIQRARDAARELHKKSPQAQVDVLIRKGTYYLDSPLALGSEDSNVTYSAFEGEEVVISGGRPISGFTETEVHGKPMLEAELADVKRGDWYFNQLFVNSRRRLRTRLPREGYFYVKSLPGLPEDAKWNVGQDNFEFEPGDLKAGWRSPEDIDIVALHFWIESRMQVKAVDEQSHIVTLNKPSTFWLYGDFSRAEGARYFVENVFEALDTPGRWYLDRKTGTLYYYPHVGENWRSAEFAAPKLDQLVRVAGSAKPNGEVKAVRFRNLKFAHTQHFLPPDSAGSSQAAIHVPGAVYFQNALDCSVENCEISHIGTYALEVAAGCSDIRFERNNIFDMGAGGVKINEGSDRTTVCDNEIGDGGKIFMSAIGVWIGNSPYNKALHNHIHNLNYTGVSVGWRWGYGESKAHHNLIEFNHIHHIGRGVLSDMGGIYTLGISPGTRLANNVIHDSLSYGYGGWGLYTDEGSSDIVLENNVVYRTKTGGFHQHYGKENILRNNIFGFATQYQLQRTRQEQHTSFIFERNIVYFDQGVLLGSNWNDYKFKMDHNVYYRAGDEEFDFAGEAFEDWQKHGLDQHSIIADPKFVDAANDDFTLQPDSPAFDLGFKQIDTSKVGPRTPVGPRTSAEGQ